jgi:hypothetical protein
VGAFIEGDVAHPRYHTVWVAMAIMAFTTNVTAVWRARFVLAGLREKQMKAANDVQRKSGPAEGPEEKLKAVS